MFDYGHFKFDSKQALFDTAIRYWNPDKTRFWQKAGIDLVIDRREGYFLYDMSGRRLIDLHLNGGTYNLGHRHPELVETLKGALDYFDIGNHWFPSVARAALSVAGYLGSMLTTRPICLTPDARAARTPAPWARMMLWVAIGASYRLR